MTKNQEFEGGAEVQEDGNVEEVVDAVLVTSDSAPAPPLKPGGVRYGSPFAGPPKTHGIPNYQLARDGAAAFDIGIAAATAQGSLLASAAIIPFSLVSIGLFPLGALLVGGLGSILAIASTPSGKVRWAIVPLAIHAAAAISGYVMTV